MTTELVRLDCAQCCVSFGVTSTMTERRRKDGERFYCPNGHANIYKNTPEAKQIESLKARVKELEEVVTAAQQEIRALTEELAIWKPRSS